MRAVLVVNPQATATTPAGRDVLAHALASEVKLDVIETDYRGHAMTAAAKAAEEGVDLVVAHGGDGTVNEVVNGLLSGGSHAPMLGVVPGGSANVFARALGLPRDPVEATGVLLKAIEDGTSRRVGLGRASWDTGSRFFTFNAGVGWDADVVAWVDRKRGKQTSPALYARAAAACYFKPAHGQPRLQIEIPGEQPHQGMRLAFVSNTDPWSYLGDRPVHLNAGCTFDGDLGLYSLSTLRLPTVLRALRQAVSKRGNQHGGKLLRRDDVGIIRVTAEEPVRLQVDGDLVGERTNVEFTSVPKALVVAV
ncbi:diacylglycerol kinase family enzyme [Kibdelosporangium banguiense]|uniref:Diacylglycerol kinase family enzyme n=1 Tax=Kibdelosporangium banguiense TaxID=1365924 RepID=A0ABS4TEQ4_9PSEU|nr:diacylglycerol kinase family protein [Kibdelosporangium banguiense]MBP2322897.1 diacylglycerol kinase family enzyme [Kibdelosporangium banguiense]